ncbi:MAG: GAF domain-containing protein [Peptoniphilaceae bacterium]|nr:GAF domain-containing protein [Peptoniphilaceae bacterium]MDD7382901.1 GAF domain-containing protein [Peptoniphilaceae bacterium]MDY3737652.1 GAF domain-containing protein [Peptoniphilaceae bacterium]
MDYFLLLKAIDNLIKSEKDPLASLSNICSFIFENIDNLNWVGFYFLRENELVLGMFQGKIACSRIKLDKGVCAEAFKKNSTVIVDDVHKFKGHIACDSNSKSEIAIPVHFKEKTIGIFDIDSPILSRFKTNEIDLFENITELIEKNVDFTNLLY